MTYSAPCSLTCLCVTLALACPVLLNELDTSFSLLDFDWILLRLFNWILDFFVK